MGFQGQLLDDEGNELLLQNAARIMRKPYKMPEYRKEDPNQWMVKGLRGNQVRRVIWK